MDRKKIQSLIFLAVGIGLFWFVYRDMKLEVLKNQLHRVQWWWIIVSILLNLFSQMVKSLRWKLLIIPLQHRPGMLNLFLSNLILAFTNLVIPRGGEIARLGVIRKFEGIPLTKLLGTAITERLTDLIVLGGITITLIIWQLDEIRALLRSAGINPEADSLLHILFISAGAVGFLIGVYWIIQKTEWSKKLTHKLKKMKAEVGEGLKTLLKVKRKGWYFFLSLFQFVLWLMMLYVIFFAFPPTRELSLKAAAFTFGLSTLAFLIPVQGGIGAWHFLVVQALMQFGIDEATGKVFALIAHSFTMLINLVIGAIAFILLPVVNRNRNAGYGNYNSQGSVENPPRS